MRSLLALFFTAGLIFCTKVNAGEEPDYTGAELFRKFCASCHGVDGRGAGPVASSLKSKVADLTQIAGRSGGKFPRDRVRQVIDGQSLEHVHGPRDMPVWGWEFYYYRGEDEARRKRVAELIERLVDYLAGMQQK